MRGLTEFLLKVLAIIAIGLIGTAASISIRDGRPLISVLIGTRQASRETDYVTNPAYEGIACNVHTNSGSRHSL